MSGVSVLVWGRRRPGAAADGFALSGVICWLSVATWAGFGPGVRPSLAQPARASV